MYWLNSFAKATGLRTEETGTETESKSAEVNEEPAATDSNKSLNGVQSEDVLDSGNKETVEIEKDKVSEGSQQLAGETDSRIGEIQSLDTLDNVSAERELGSLDNVSAEEEIGSLDNVLAEEEIGSLDNVLAEKELGSLDSVLAEKELGSLENISAGKELGSLENVAAEGEIGSQDDVSAEKDLGSLENASAEKELGSLENVSVEEGLGSLDSVSAEKEVGLQSKQSKASISVEKSSLEFEEQGAESKDENPENKGLAGEESVKPRRVESSVSLSTSSKDKDLSMTVEKRHESLISISIQSCKLGDAESLTGSAMKDQSCQASCSLDEANVDELRKLKEKLAISKKDTETMQKLLEDVRNDYEDLQKSFEKRDREIKKERAETNLKLSKTDGSISSACDDIPKPKSSELRPKSSELRPKSSELRPKSSELRPKSSELRPKSSEKRRRGAEKSSVTSREKLVESSYSVTCPCLTQNIRKIITDVTEDFKEVISAIKKSSAEEREIIVSEFVRFKDEYRCALEKKDFEIHAMEETIKGLQARIREGEREADECRKTISLAFAEKEKLHLGIQGLNEELTKAQHEREISQANLERIKDCLKRYCTVEEYEELQRMDFKFTAVREVEETSDLKMNTDNIDYKKKKNECYTVLRKTKKDLKKLKKEKGDLEHLLKERLMQSIEKDKDLNQKLSKALDSLKENEVKVAELAERLETSEAENNNLTAKISELEGRGQNMQRDYGFEMEAAKDESKISEESVATNKVKYIELQREHESLRHGYNGLKKFLEYLTSAESGIFADASLENEDSVGYSPKVNLVLCLSFFVVMYAVMNCAHESAEKPCEVGELYFCKSVCPCVMTHHRYPSYALLLIH